MVSCSSKPDFQVDKCEAWLLIALEDQVVRFNYRYYAKKKMLDVYPELTIYPIDLFLIGSFDQYSRGTTIDSTLIDFKSSLTNRGLDSAIIDSKRYVQVVKEGAYIIKEFRRRDSINFTRLKNYLNTYGFSSDDCSHLGLIVTRYQVMNHHNNKEEYKAILEKLWAEKKIDSIHYSKLKMN